MKLVGLGDNVVDRYLNKGVMFPGGNAVNVAAHASRLGIQSAYLGNIGDDDGGNLILKSLQALNVDTQACVVVKDSTTKYCDVNVYEGERSFVGVDLGKCWSGSLILNQKHLDYLQSFDLIHSSCNAKMEDEISKLQHYALISYDFGEKAKYRVDDYLLKICPFIDLALFSMNDITLDEIYEFSKHVHHLGAKHILITRGNQGSILYNGESFIKGEIEYVEAIDTMGAGDSFLSAFVISLMKSGWKKKTQMKQEAIEKALSEGAHYSAKNCMIQGGF